MKYFIILFVLSGNPEVHSINEVPNKNSCKLIEKEVNADGTFKAFCLELSNKQLKVI